MASDEAIQNLARKKAATTAQNKNMAGRRITKRPEPLLQQNQPAQNKNFDWGKAYMRDLTTTNAQGVPRIIAGTEGGATASDLIQSGKNIYQGEGGFLDWASLLLAPTAFTGYGAVKGVKAVDKVAANRVIKKVLENPDISIVAPREAMPEILNSRFKSQRELLSEKPGFDPTKFGNREAVEASLMGYPLDLPVSQRPIYGAVANKTDLPQWLLEKTPGKTGDALRLFDPRTNRSGVFGNGNAVISRVPASAVEGSFTIGDSWVPAVSEAFDMKQLQNPQVRKDILEALTNARNPRTPTNFAVEGKLPYIEAQMAASKNPVDAISRIDFPPSYRQVWDQASKQARGVYTNNGGRLLDPIIRKVPKVQRQLVRKPDAETLRYQELLFNNPARPQIRQKALKEILGSEKRALKGAKGKVAMPAWT